MREGVARIFPILLNGFAKALETKPDLRGKVVTPSQQIRALVESILQAYPNLVDKVSFCSNEEKGLPASAVLMSSGTMSLAVALSGIPGAIAYRLNPLSYLVGKILVDIKYIGISNLLLDRPLHPEYIQGEASPEKLAAEILRASSTEAASEAAEGAEDIRRMLNPASDANAADWLAAELEHFQKI